MVKLQGDLLKINEGNDDEGVFFIKSSDDTETKVQFINESFPKNLLIEVPDTLTKGDYYVEVRNRTKNGKSLRSGRLLPKVKVA